MLVRPSGIGHRLVFRIPGIQTHSIGPDRVLVNLLCSFPELFICTIGVAVIIVILNIRVSNSIGKVDARWQVPGVLTLKSLRVAIFAQMARAFWMLAFSSWSSILRRHVSSSSATIALILSAGMVTTSVVSNRLSMPTIRCRSTTWKMTLRMNIFSAS